MQQLTIRMPDDHFQEIQQIAKASGLKKSDVTRLAIKRFIEDFKAKKDTDLYAQAKPMIGVVESGISDLGANHRKYLISKIRGQK